MKERLGHVPYLSRAYCLIWAPQRCFCPTTAQRSFPGPSSPRCLECTHDLRCNGPRVRPGGATRTPISYWYIRPDVLYHHEAPTTIPCAWSIIANTGFTRSSVLEHKIHAFSSIGPTCMLGAGRHPP